MRIAMIGCGVVGRAVAQGVDRGAVGEGAEIVACLVRRRTAEAAAVLAPDCTVTTDPERFFARESDLILEVAGQPAVREYARRALDRADLMITSVGALSDDALRHELSTTARAAGRRIWVPSGAIAALDGVEAAAMGRVDEVVHVTRKPPRAWKDTPAEEMVDLDSLSQPFVLYEGNPRESARLFPANVNVQTAVALAGVGVERTRVKVVADPTIERNHHEIRVRGEFGEFTLQIELVPTENPKTGLMTVFGVLKALRRLNSALVVGI